MNALVPLAAALLLAAPAAAQSVYETDTDFALEELEELCGGFFDAKDIDWKKVSKEMRKASKLVEDDQQHLVLMTRLLARLRDGHARVEKRDSTQDVAWPEDGLFGTSVERGGTGLALCRNGRKVLVKSVAGPASDARVLLGSEVLEIDGEKADAWLEARVETWGDVVSWSTAQQADAWARHWGMSAEVGGRMKLELREPGGKKKTRTVTVGSRSVRTAGPAIWPEGLQTEGEVSWTTLDGGWGYIYLRRCRSGVLEQMDTALAALDEVPGIILDFRGNGGGGFDHDALLGRFVPDGQELGFVKRIPSAGPRQYGGPVVVLVDATTVSAGETGSGMFKEEGRALMLGPTPTAGMSSSKETVELPSGKFALYVSVHSNKSRWQGGRGIEGVGVEPHEIVEYEPEDLAEGVDTLIRVACERLEKGGWKEVPYDPEDFGWEKP
jgi:C-terminal processing protease CtpA/Prc